MILCLEMFACWYGFGLKICYTISVVIFNRTLPYIEAVSAIPSYCFWHKLYFIKFITYALKQVSLSKVLYFFDSVDSWKLRLLRLGCSTEFCYFQSTGSISLVSKGLFRSVVFYFLTADEFLEIFVAFKSCIWFVLKNFFRDSLTGFVSS